MLAAANFGLGFLSRPGPYDIDTSTSAIQTSFIWVIRVAFLLIWEAALFRIDPFSCKFLGVPVDPLFTTD